MPVCNNVSKSEEPSEEPSEESTEEPGEEPTEKPSEEPSEEPTEEPSEEPTEEPGEEPTEKPSEEPSEEPTEEPSEEPSEESTEKPGEEPTEDPSEGKISFNAEDFGLSLGNKKYVYNGKPQEPVVKFTYKKKKLVKDKDYTVSYRNNTNACGAEAENAPQIIIRGINDYYGEISIRFTIEAKSLSKKNATLHTKKYEVDDYTVAQLQQGLKPGVQVKDTSIADLADMKYQLTEGKDYTVAYAGHQKAGKAKAIITGIGNYAGKVELTYEIKGINLAKLTFDKIPVQTYKDTPCVVVPKISAKSLKKYKVEEICYDTVYVNNDVPGTATIYLYAKPGTKTYGDKTLTFKISKAPLTSDLLVVGTQKDANGQVIPGIADVVYDAKEQKHELVVAYKLNGKQILLQEGKDYAVSYSNHVNAGKADKNGKIAASAKVLIKGKGNYNGSVAKYFAILPVGIETNESFEFVTPPTMKYTGKNVNPKVEITFINSEGKRSLLKAGKDYKVISDQKGKKGETVEVRYTIKGIGNFNQMLEKSIVVTDEKIKVTVKSATRYYTGAPIEPGEDEIAVYRGKKLIDPSEYAISYANNLNAGKASVMIKGVDFYGTATFQITPQKLAHESNKGTIRIEAPASKPYSGNPVMFGKDELKLYQIVSGRYLKEGKDYVLKYAANTTPGRATLTITGKGNYSGSMKYSFTIDRIKAFSSDYLVIEVNDCIYNAKTQKPKVKVLYYPAGTGKGESIELKEKSAYTVTYKNHKNAGVATVIVKPKQSVYDKISVKELEKNFRIRKASLSGNGAGIKLATIKPQTYKNKPVTPKLTLTMNGYTLKENVDYTVQYTENHQRGIATATISGCGNFEGVRMTKFIIR